MVVQFYFWEWLDYGVFEYMSFFIFQMYVWKEKGRMVGKILVYCR